MSFILFIFNYFCFIWRLDNGLGVGSECAHMFMMSQEDIKSVKFQEESIVFNDGSIGKVGLPSVNDLVILGEKIDVTYHKITNDSEQFAKQSSGWSLYRIVDLQIFTGKYKPIKGGHRYIHQYSRQAEKQQVQNMQHQIGR